ncbi:hypothetical protein Hanom_Chr15g01408031 [Helianthus anomalus]
MLLARLGINESGYMLRWPPHTLRIQIDSKTVICFVISFYPYPFDNSHKSFWC